MARVLVAEDDRDIREMVTFKLRGQGHAVTAVADGAAALASARCDPPDLAVLDVMMPGMSGLEARRELRSRPETSGLPIILMTARVPENELMAELGDGTDGLRDETYLYVTKPFSPQELARRVAAVLGRTAPRSA